MTEEDLSTQEGTELKQEFWKLDEVGSSITGVLVEKRMGTNTMKSPSCKQTIYTIMKDDGKAICIGGRGSNDPQVIAGLEQAKLGQVVQVKYMKDIPATKPGNHDAKIVKTFSKGEMKEDVLAKYLGTDSLDTSDLTEEM